MKGSSKKKHLSQTFWELLILFVACPSFEILSLSQYAWEKVDSPPSPKEFYNPY